MLLQAANMHCSAQGMVFVRTKNASRRRNPQKTVKKAQFEGECAQFAKLPGTGGTFRPNKKLVPWGIMHIHGLQTHRAWGPRVRECCWYFQRNAARGCPGDVNGSSRRIYCDKPPMAPPAPPIAGAPPHSQQRKSPWAYRCLSAV